MNKAIPVTLGGRIFPDKQSCEAHFSTLLQSTPIGARLGHEDFLLTMELLRRHSEAIDKIGVGTDYIYVDKVAHFFSGKCFHVRRIDGTSTDFSYRRCISAKVVSLLDEWRQAARAGVAGQIAWYRDFYFDGRSVAPSELSGLPVTYLEGHVDHAPPNTFVVLMHRFLEQAKLEPSYSWLSVPGDNNYVCTITDHNILREWRKYHEDNAKLRVVTKQENLSMGAHKNTKVTHDQAR